MKFSKNRNGFTFVELLVVTTIIILLSSIAVVSYQSANKKSRDNKRKSDLEQIRTALEMYRSDQGGYPTALSILTPNFLQQIPTDPKGYSYYYSRPTATTYNLCAYLESDTSGNCGGASCGSGITCNYKVTQP